MREPLVGNGLNQIVSGAKFSVNEESGSKTSPYKNKAKAGDLLLK